VRRARAALLANVPSHVAGQMYVLVTHRNVAVYPGGTYRRELNFFVRLAMLLQITQRGIAATKDEAFLSP
jgi:hypothetical protein